MKEVTYTELKKKQLSEILKGQCLRVTGNCETAFYVIVKPEGLMRDKIEGVCSQIDASRGLKK